MDPSMRSVQQVPAEAYMHIFVLACQQLPTLGSSFSIFYWFGKVIGGTLGRHSRYSSEYTGEIFPPVMWLGCDACLCS